MTMRKTVAAACLLVLLAGCAGESTTEADQPPAGTGGQDQPATDGAGATDDAAETTGFVPDDSSGATSAPGHAAETTEAEPSETEPAEAAAELPRGGTEIFPRYQLFGYSGAPLSEGLGRLGIGDLHERVVEMEERGVEYVGPSREIMPVLELIATIVRPVAGDDDVYRTHQSDEVVEDHLAAARRHDSMLLLNIQSGRADFIDEVERWEEFLLEPDVGVALDPEWAVGEGQIRGEVYGRTSGEELDEVAAYLAGLVEEHDLPEKVMVYHQVSRDVIQEEDDLTEHDGVVTIKSVDGIGDAESKIETYDAVNKDKPDHVVAGFKLFYEEDTEYGPIMTGQEVLGLDPVPQYVLFE